LKTTRTVAKDQTTLRQLELLVAFQTWQVHAQTMGESGEPFFVRDAIKGMSPRIVYDRSSVFDRIWPCLLLRQKTGLG